MKKNKNYIWAKFCSYFSNELTKSQLSDLKADIINSDNAKLFTMINKDIESLDKTAYMFDKKTDQAWNKLHNDILTHERKRNRIHIIVRKPFFKIAASIILLVSISLFALTMLNQSKINKIQTQAFHSTEVLPDGTTVYLNAHSTIEFPNNFSSNSREVKLSGEAFFDVVKDAKRPFIITANDARIEVLGTSFNILANKKNKKVEVLVESGTVSLSSVNNHEKLILTKGQSGLFQNESLLRNEIIDLNYLSWKTNLIDFREAPLNYVVDILNKTYASNIIINDDISSNFKLNAKFDQAPLNTVLESICLAFNLEQKQMNGEIQIVNKTD